MRNILMTVIFCGLSFAANAQSAPPPEFPSCYAKSVQQKMLPIAHDWLLYKRGLNVVKYIPDTSSSGYVYARITDTLYCGGTFVGEQSVDMDWELARIDGKFYIQMQSFDKLFRLIQLGADITKPMSQQRVGG